MEDLFYGPGVSKKLHTQMEEDKRWTVNADNLSEEEQKSIKDKILALDKFFGNAILAKYKIELHFGKDRSSWKPFAGMLSIFTSGSKLHGGGDEKAYLCPNSDCGQVLTGYKSRIGNKIICLSCGKFWKSTEIIGEIFYNLTPQKWAHVIHRMFVHLGHNADIYLKYHPTDIRYQTSMELARDRGGEELNKTRYSRGLHIYPLKNIITDTKNGAELYKRFITFITS